MWQYRQTDELYPHYNVDNTDELYHYGRLGMRWGQHIFGDSYKYKSLGQIRLSRKLKSIRKKTGTNSSEYKKIKNKYKKVKKRDAKEYNKFKKDQELKKDRNRQKALKKNNGNDEYVKKIKSIKLLSNKELDKQVSRLRSENEYYRLKAENDKYRNAKKRTNSILGKIGKSVLVPALTESGKTVLQDLLIGLGKAKNEEIINKYKERNNPDKDNSDKNNEKDTVKSNPKNDKNKKYKKTKETGLILYNR